jgi:hypothetical protein
MWGRSTHLNLSMGNLPTKHFKEWPWPNSPGIKISVVHLKLELNILEVKINYHKARTITTQAQLEIE